MVPDTEKYFDKLYPTALREKEAQAVHQRRCVLKMAKESDSPPTELPKDTVGVALSGGGIRSATFCLGVFQWLAEKDLLKRIDYLSTVSGGGYFGSFWGGWINRLRFRSTPENGASQTMEAAQASLKNDLSPETFWLRENGRYLMPNGSGDALLAAAIAVRNVVTIHFILGWLALALFLTANIFSPYLSMISGWIVVHFRWLLDKFFLHGTPSVEAPSTIYDHLWNVAPVNGEVHFTLVDPPASWLSELFARPSPWLLLPVASLLVALILGFLYWARYWNSATKSNRNSRALATTLGITAGLLAFALIDTIASGLTDKIHQTGLPGFTSWLLSGILALAGTGFVHGLSGPLLKLTQSKRAISLPITFIAGAVAVVLIAIWFIFWCVLAHLIVPATIGAQINDGYLRLLFGPLMIVFMIGFSVVLSRKWPLFRDMIFLNLSSLATLYSSRLTRAYLGASNLNRGKHFNVTETIEGDEIPYGQYHPHLAGGPLHLINVTINETVLGRSQTVQRDRKGIPMAVGPCGLTVSSCSHTLWVEQTNPDNGKPERTGEITPIISDPQKLHLLCEGKPVESGRSPEAMKHKVEMLSLGEWAGVSGAAVSTGQGAHTSLGLSLLFGFFNVRLGWWWNSYVDPAKQPDRQPLPPAAQLVRVLADWLPSHANLLNEFLARFPGPNEQHWYLSDGGHFENTAAYELLRRRLPLVIILDNGCDPKRTFDDFANLVRKARLDFNAEIEVITPRDTPDNQAARKYIGTIKELQETNPATGLHDKFALLAEARYPDGKKSIILLIKPTIIAKLPEDVLNYHTANKSFPQESTADQFFNEAQWESYRKLGYTLAKELFIGLNDNETWMKRFHPVNVVGSPE